MAFNTNILAHCDAVWGGLQPSHLGDPVRDAFERAEQRLLEIEGEIQRPGHVPYQGSLAPKIMDGLRHVTKNSAVFYFVVDEDEWRVRILGVFFGGQDHRTHILRRIVAAKP